MSLSATSKWGYYNYVNFKWVTTQFATAMGIGILFVPQEIGPKAIGLFPFITLAIICIPLAYLNHKTLSNLIISGGMAVDQFRQYNQYQERKHRTHIHFYYLFPVLRFA